MGGVGGVGGVGTLGPAHREAPPPFSPASSGKRIGHDRDRDRDRDRAGVLAEQRRECLEPGLIHRHGALRCGMDAVGEQVGRHMSLEQIIQIGPDQ